MEMVTVLLALVLSCLLVILYAMWRGYSALRHFVSQAAPDKPSPLGEAVSAVARTFGQEIALHLKTAILGKSSALTKAVNGIEADLATDGLANAHPGVAALMALSPKLTKRLMNSPVAQIALSKILESRVGGKQPSNGANPAGDTSLTL